MTVMRTPAVRRRRILLAGLLPTLIAVVLTVDRPALVASLDNRAYDQMLRWSRSAPPRGQVAIVDIDQRSLLAVGQWPWRRDIVGHLIAKIRDLGARAIALDVIFSEPDREQRVPASSDGVSYPSNAAVTPDAALASVLSSGRAVLGYAFTFDGDRASAACVLHPLRVAVVQPADDDVMPAFEASGAICNLPELAKAAGASGFLNAVPDSDGIIRRAPLVVAHDGSVYPSLALAAVEAATGARATDLRVANANTTWLRVGDETVPLDGKGNLLLRYRGKKRTFPFVSAADVLSGEATRGVFDGKIVFIGTTALGIEEDVSTPLDTRFTGVEVQATIAENLLRHDFIRRPEHALAAEMAMLAFTLIVVWAARAGTSAAILSAVASCGTLWVGATWLLSAQGIFLSPVLPTTAVVLALPAALALVSADAVSRATATVRKARRQTAVARSARHQLLRKVSHELRTPLAAVYGWAQLLGSGVLRGDQRREALSTITQNLRLHNRMIDDLLDMSQAARGDLRLTIADVDVGALLREVVNALRSIVDAKRLTLELWIDPTLGSIPGDRERLRQVIFSLLANAIAFTPERGKIRAQLAGAGGQLQLVVSDTGAGIAPEFLPHVFDEFRQQEDGTTRRDAGLGLGLAIARHLVELHGGSITAASEGPGRGATMTVRLPIGGSGVVRS